MNNFKLPTSVVIAALLAFVAVLAAYVVLAVTGHGDAAGSIVPAVVSLLGVLGLGVHQSSRLSQQDEALTTITKQTNGVLTKRIKDGADAAMRQVLREAGYHVPDAAPAEADDDQDGTQDGTGGTGQ